MEIRSSSKKETALRLVEEAVQCIGLGYDLTLDLRLNYCKKQPKDDSRLIGIDDDNVRDITIPGGLLVQNVPQSIKCDKGERMRFATDVLSFQQMSEQFNQEVSLTGRVPSGHFNTAFEFTGSWQKDAAFTKSLSFDGVFITLYSIALEKYQVQLLDYVKQAVPTPWDPASLARFIQKYGTHVIIGIKIGGKDVVYVKQQHSSPLQPADVQKRLKDLADKRFSDASGHSGMHPEKRERTEQGLALWDLSMPSFHPKQEDITFFWRRRGGSISRNIHHNKWCQTVQFEPEVISMSFIPISSLLSGVSGSGFLNHAINLYLRYQPPIEEFQQFLEFQLPKKWAPEFGDLPLGPHKKLQSGISLQFGLMGPKLYVNTNQVHSGNMPITGLRLYLEGKKGNCLAIHMQHLSSLPKSFQLQSESGGNNANSCDHRYHEKVHWSFFSHICTAPVESDDDLSIVTGGNFEVRKSIKENILFLRLHFSKVLGAMVVQRPVWDDSPSFAQKSGVISSLVSTLFSSGQKSARKPRDVNIDSAAYPQGPPIPIQTNKFLRYVDTTEIERGPQEQPGYWVVSGARLVVDQGKIYLRVKYSLLAVILPDE